MTQLSNDFTVLGSALLSYFVDKGVYPDRLSDLVGVYLAKDNPVVLRLNDYEYRKRANGKKYALYLKTSRKESGQGTAQYYGISSESSYPHPLSQRDFE